MKYEDLTVKELRERAKKKGIKNISKMTKVQLIKALKNTEKDMLNAETGMDSNLFTPSSPSSSPTSTSFTEQKQSYRVVKEDYPIPETYNLDTLVLLPVDPAIQYCYWQVSTNTRLQYKNYLVRSFYRYKLKLFAKDSEGTKEIQEIEVGDYGNFYFHHYLPGRIAWAEVGFMSDEGIFIPIMTSKRIIIPRDTLSSITDETFMTVQENYMEILKLSGIDSDAHPGSIEFHKALLKQLLKNISSKDSFSKGV
jgi:hypothetical protein